MTVNNCPPMNTKLTELAHRKAALVRKVERQRKELTQVFEPWHGPLSVVDKGLLVMRYLRRHPALLAAGFAFAASVRPKGMMGWLRRGWLLWQTAVEIKRSLSR